MSLICVMCNKTIVQSDNPDHLGVCSACPTNELTDEQKARFEESNENFARLSKEASQK